MVAVVKTKPGRKDLSDEAIIQTLKADLANYKVPKRVFFTDELPRNTMGKVQKNLLRDQYKELFRAAR